MSHNWSAWPVAVCVHVPSKVRVIHRWTIRVELEDCETVPRAEVHASQCGFECVSARTYQIRVCAMVPCCVCAGACFQVGRRAHAAVQLVRCDGRHQQIRSDLDSMDAMRASQGRTLRAHAVS